MVLGHSLVMVSLTAEITHEAAADLAIAEGRNIISTEVTFGCGLYASLNLLEVLNVHILREAFNPRGGKVALVETLWAIDGWRLVG